MCGVLLLCVRVDKSHRVNDNNNTELGLVWCCFIACNYGILLDILRISGVQSIKDSRSAFWSIENVVVNLAKS